MLIDWANRPMRNFEFYGSPRFLLHLFLKSPTFTDWVATRAARGRVRGCRDSVPWRNTPPF